MRLLIQLLLVIILSVQCGFSQNNTGNIVFWSAQKWDCEFMHIDLYNEDSMIVYSGKLDKVYKDFEIPDCGNEQTLSVTDIQTGDYFFVADCTKEQCAVCAGEGSYWQPIVQNETPTGNRSRNKGNIEGTWRTCYLCNGDGQASTILWIDTLTVYQDKCRSVLLK